MLVSLVCMVLFMLYVPHVGFLLVYGAFFPPRGIQSFFFAVSRFVPVDVLSMLCRALRSLPSSGEDDAAAVDALHPMLLLPPYRS